MISVAYQKRGWLEDKANTRGTWAGRTAKIFHLRPKLPRKLRRLFKPCAWRRLAKGASTPCEGCEVRPGQSSLFAHYRRIEIVRTRRLGSEVGGDF